MATTPIALSEAARRLKISMPTAYSWVKAGKLRVTRVSGAYGTFVTEASVERLLEKRSVRT